MDLDAGRRRQDPPGPAGTLGSRACVLAAGVLAVLLAAWPAALGAAELGTLSPSKVEAGYLRNFARYVTWPEGPSLDPATPWRIGVLGRDAFADVLEQLLEGRTEQGRRFEIVRASSAHALRGCHIVFVGYADSPRRRAALAELSGGPVLTVGDADAFLEEGGVIQFVVRDTVQMTIDLDHARRAALKIQTKMLEVARAIVENGVTRGPR